MHNLKENVNNGALHYNNSTFETIWPSRKSGLEVPHGPNMARNISSLQNEVVFCAIFEKWLQ
jgi:hypothetical protein